MRKNRCPLFFQPDWDINIYYTSFQLAVKIAWQRPSVCSGYSLPAAPGKVSSAPELQGLKEAIPYDQCLHPGVPWVPPDLVHQSVAAGVLSSNPPAAESTVRPKLNTYMCTYILSNQICFKVYRNQINFRTWSTLITAVCSSACFSWNRLLTWSISAATHREQDVRLKLHRCSY